jgi:glycosyltransferase involved in cell wall biosynthesis
MLFSLIVPTLHRTAELRSFLDSIIHQELNGFSLEEIEIIIADQNTDDRLTAVIAPYEKQLKIVHLKAPPLGQSHAKNAGMKKAQGKYVSFPDDDCYYSEDTLGRVYQAFKENKDRFALFGRGLDPETGQYLLKYPPQKCVISSPKDPALFLGLQIAQFYTLETALAVGDFDVDLCSGGKWGSGEDADFAIRFLKNRGSILFLPEIIVKHPLVTSETMEIGKLNRYAMGFGALCRKQSLYGIFFFKTLKQISGFLFFAMAMKWRKSKVCWNIAVSRLKGFMEYKNA